MPATSNCATPAARAVCSAASGPAQRKRWQCESNQVEEVLRLTDLHALGRVADPDG